MVVSDKFYIGFNDIYGDFSIKNSAILCALGDMAGMHSNLVGDGIKATNNQRWFLISYKVNVLKRPKLGEHITVKTWSVGYKGVQADREFEVVNEKGEKLVLAKSLWALVDLDTKRITRLTADIMDIYKSEPEHTNFNGSALNKLSAPEGKKVYEMVVDWRYIDCNKHLNNTYYLDIAEYALKLETKTNINNLYFDIYYKKEIKEGDTINLYYSKDEFGHYIVIKNADESLIHSIIKFYE